ncbi:MAG: glycosyltransferase family 1 protein [Lachnospiraceae bacterium]|jgi:glycosyltransferase involved in cell wall biosynthesis|nr:glycosyltransferase family 1 protein [Lachnospiraceae bacterium]
MKVLIKLVGLRSGGIETLVVKTSEQLQNFGLEFDFLTDKKKTEFYDQKLKDLHINKYALGLNLIPKYKMPVQKILGMYKIVKENQYDVVHINESVLHSVMSAFVCRMAGVKKIIVHSHTNSKNDIHNFSWHMNGILKKMVAILATDYIACSMHAAEWAFPKKLIKEGKVKILNNGIDVDKFSFDLNVRKKVRYELNIKEDEILIGHVGRFVYQKNQEFIIEIAKELYQSGIRNIKILLVGEGELVETIRSRIREYHLENYIILYGASENISELLQGMDLFLFPSRCEGLGIVAVEAQAAGLMVIASNNVPEEAKLTPLFKQYDLSIGASEWARKLLCELKALPERKKMDQYIINGNYDFSTTVSCLYSIYTGEIL